MSADASMGTAQLMSCSHVLLLGQILPSRALARRDKVLIYLRRVLLNLENWARTMNKLRVLAVDDDEDILDTIDSALSSMGLHVLRASDGAEAQHVLSKHSNVALLLTDFRMPHIDGAELLTWCRESGFHFPVVLLSSSFALYPKEKLALCDCCAFLLYKPFDLASLATVLKAALERRHEELCDTIQ